MLLNNIEEESHQRRPILIPKRFAVLATIKFELVFGQELDNKKDA